MIARILKFLKKKSAAQESHVDTFCLRGRKSFFPYLEYLARDGFAYAKNDYLSKKYGVSIRTIQRWLTEEVSSGRIEIVHGRPRKIFIKKPSAGTPFAKKPQLKPQSRKLRSCRIADVTPVTSAATECRLAVMPPRQNVAPFKQDYINTPREIEEQKPPGPKKSTAEAMVDLWPEFTIEEAIGGDPWLQEEHDRIVAGRVV